MITWGDKMTTPPESIVVLMRGDDLNNLASQNQFLLKYVHAALASDVAPDDFKFDDWLQVV